MDNKINIIGAGLAGSECAFQLAEKGYQVQIFEMRPHTSTAVHKTAHAAELVCSNSFGSQTDYSASGQLKWEAEQLNSLILDTARKYSVPAGMSLSIDREKFPESIQKTLAAHPNITITNEVFHNIEDLEVPTVVATGPLTHPDLAASIASHFSKLLDDKDFLYFYDAIAPIIDTDSINMDIAWMQNRYEDDNGHYINCPLTKEQYYNLINEINEAKKMEFKEFEKISYFESCMPIEVLASRGIETARFGPMSPKGLTSPAGEKFYGIVQLRQDNQEKTAYNMVGFQTKMAYGEQKRVFRQIPGLEDAEFLKLGSIHKNMYLNSPRVLNSDLSSKNNPNLYFAGQLTGVEGYFESTCVGLLVALFIDQKMKDQRFFPPPRASAMGSLLHALQEAKDNFQPTNINFGLLPKIEMEKRNKRLKKERQLEIAKSEFRCWLQDK